MRCTHAAATWLAWKICGRAPPPQRAQSANGTRTATVQGCPQSRSDTARLLAVRTSRPAGERLRERSGTLHSGPAWRRPAWPRRTSHRAAWMSPSVPSCRTTPAAAAWRRIRARPPTFLHAIPLEDPHCCVRRTQARSAARRSGAAATAQIRPLPALVQLKPGLLPHSGLGRFGLSCGGKRVAQMLLFLFIERGLQNGPSGILDFIEDLVCRHALDQQE